MTAEKSEVSTYIHSRIHFLWEVWKFQTFQTFGEKWIPGWNPFLNSITIGNPFKDTLLCSTNGKKSSWLHAGTKENIHADQWPWHAALNAWRRPGSRPTVLIHLLNAGSSGKQLLDRLLQTASCCQMEGAGRDNVKKFHSTTPPPAQLFTNHCPQFSPLSLFSFHSHTSPSLTEILS